jgi:transcriptional regulator with XRE-family HTH domain
LDQKKTGQFLKMLRNEKKLTQEQLAKQFNVSNRSVSRWETGTNLPDISLLVEIADFYDVDVREIIDGERKSEMMDKETREVADKMAVYAGNEKSNLLRGIQVASIIGVVISIVAIVLQTLSYEPDLKRAIAILATFTGFVIMCIITLYVTGVLQKIGKHRKAVKAIKITTIVLLAVVTHYLLMAALVIGFFAASFYGAKVEVSTDPGEYNKYIHGGKNNEYAMGDGEMFDVFPQTIPANADITDYQLTYYNPWDGQYVVYMTLDYKSGYEDEAARLSGIGVEDYTGIYSVTGAPDGYKLIAMDSDDYSGFVYAMVPENAEGNTKITYVAIVFCNYFLDLDVHDYMKEEYLLKGFDATDDNPYRKEMLDE